MLSAVHLSGIIAILGAGLYALGDVLLLATKVGAVLNAPPATVDLTAYPRLQRRAELISRLGILPWWRVAWGGLLGVFAAPLTLAGVWQVFQGLRPAGLWSALPPALLFVYATVIGPFIHGSFIYLAQNAQTLNAIDNKAHPLLLDVISRQQTVMWIGYSVLFVCNILASIWFSLAVWQGQTGFPVWMAWVNPVTATIVWLTGRRLLPESITRYVEGAGFNIAYLSFYTLTTITLW